MIRKFLPAWLVTGLVLGSATVLTKSAEARENAGPTIAEIVVSNPDVDGDGEGDFDTLLVAVQAADESVLERLSANGQNTVFAPTDAAFEAAFEELGMLGITPGDVLANTELLTLILNYHISPGRRDSTEVLSSDVIRMRDGGFLYQDSGTLFDELDREAGFVLTDVEARNGIVHAIDNVVLPGLP